MTTEARLYYAHDPMCSWCWAFAPIWDKLEQEIATHFSEKIRVEKLLGGLAPDSEERMPEAMQQRLQETWATIQQRVPGTQFNFDFWHLCKPRRSTWRACRAVIAARNQEQQFDSLMTWAIQQAYYLRAKNPSDRDTLVTLAADIGADYEQFAEDLDSEATRAHHQKEMQLVRQLGIQGFPSLVLIKGQQANGIKLNFSETDTMMEQIGQQLAANAA